MSEWNEAIQKMQDETDAKALTDLLLSDAVYLEGLAFVRTGAEASRLTAIAYRIRSALVASPPSPKLGVAVEALRDARPHFAGYRLDQPEAKILAQIDAALSQLEKPGE